MIDELHSCPVAVVVVRLRPARARQARVVGLAVVDVAGEDGAARSAPGLVGHDAIGCAIGIAYFKLGQEREPFAVTAFCSLFAQRAPGSLF